MAARITITPEELRNASTFFGQKAEDISTMLEALRHEVDNLESTWEGAAQDQFFLAYEEMAKNLQSFPEIVAGISQQLASVADTLESTDQAIADSFKSR